MKLFIKNANSVLLVFTLACTGGSEKKSSGDKDGNSKSETKCRTSDYLQGESEREVASQLANQVKDGSHAGHVIEKILKKCKVKDKGTSNENH